MMGVCTSVVRGAWCVSCVVCGVSQVRRFTSPYYDLDCEARIVCGLDWSAEFRFDPSLNRSGTCAPMPWDDSEDVSWVAASGFNATVYMITRIWQHVTPNRRHGNAKDTARWLIDICRRIARGAAEV